MADPTNEVVAGLVVPDAYTAAASLGPSPGIMTGADITCKRADVLMQFAIEKDGGGVWLENREYPMGPGSKHATNVCGVRFRNRIAGDAAIIDASLTGPYQPILSPLQHLAATGIGDVLLSQQLSAATPQSFGPFDVGDWPYLLLGLDAVSNAGVAGARLAARYALTAQQVGTVDQPLEVLDGAAGAFTGGIARSGLRVVPNLTRQVTLQVDQSGNLTTSIFVAPCAFPSVAPWFNLNFIASGVAPGILLAQTTAVVAPGVSNTYLIQPHEGLGQLTLSVAPTGGGGWDCLLQSVDYTNTARPGFLWGQSGLAGSGRYSVEVPLAPSPMVLTITNQGNVNGSHSVMLAAKARVRL